MGASVSGLSLPKNITRIQDAPVLQKAGAAVPEFAARVEDVVDWESLNGPATRRGIPMLVELDAMRRCDNWLWRPLHYAALHGATAAVERLLNAGAVVDARTGGHAVVGRFLTRDTFNFCSELECLLTGEPAIVKAVAVNGDHALVVHKTLGTKAAIPLTELRCIGYASIHYPPHVRHFSYVTPLHIAIEYMHIGVIQALLEKAADPNLAWNHGQHYPLHMSIWQGNYKASHLLLQHSADANFEDGWGRSPLATAAICPKQTPRFVGIMLLEAGAERLATDNSGKTAAQLARECENKEIATVLESYQLGDSKHGKNMPDRDLVRGGQKSADGSSEARTQTPPDEANQVLSEVNSFATPDPDLPRLHERTLLPGAAGDGNLSESGLGMLEDALVAPQLPPLRAPAPVAAGRGFSGPPPGRGPGPQLQHSLFGARHDEASMAPPALPSGLRHDEQPQPFHPAQHNDPPGSRYDYPDHSHNYNHSHNHSHSHNPQFPSTDSYHALGPGPGPAGAQGWDGGAGMGAGQSYAQGPPAAPPFPRRHPDVPGLPSQPPDFGDISHISAPSDAPTTYSRGSGAAPSPQREQQPRRSLNGALPPLGSTAPRLPNIPALPKALPKTGAGAGLGPAPSSVPPLALAGGAAQHQSSNIPPPLDDNMLDLPAGISAGAGAGAGMGMLPHGLVASHSPPSKMGATGQLLASAMVSPVGYTPLATMPDCSLSPRGGSGGSGNGSVRTELPGSSEAGDEASGLPPETARTATPGESGAGGFQLPPPRARAGSHDSDAEAFKVLMQAQSDAPPSTREPRKQSPSILVKSYEEAAELPETPGGPSGEGEEKDNFSSTLRHETPMANTLRRIINEPRPGPFSASGEKWNPHNSAESFCPGKTCPPAMLKALAQRSGSGPSGSPLGQTMQLQSQQASPMRPAPLPLRSLTPLSTPTALPMTAQSSDSSKEVRSQAEERNPLLSTSPALSRFITPPRPGPFAPSGPATGRPDAMTDLDDDARSEATVQLSGRLVGASELKELAPDSDNESWESV